MAGVQQIYHCLGREFEPNLHSKSHAKGHQQQVLAQTVLLRPRVVFAHYSELLGDVYLPERHAYLHHRDEDDDQTFGHALLGRDEGGALGAPVALELRIHPAVDPVQQAGSLLCLKDLSEGKHKYNQIIQLRSTLNTSDASDGTDRTMRTGPQPDTSGHLQRVLSNVPMKALCAVDGSAWTQCDSLSY
ncbi:hypothetical protein EYF80_003042 [Liparis tanakae]|uniref:Uncharacterized protein n=1 Tax=Liparis tanakae TaxID=230148 RepID=A0A4Z2J9G6_9TELE|nr:hypothetical protein EYF80_003042 [Liparis tanakae]